jgi:ankyrin repeat protein
VAHVTTLLDKQPEFVNAHGLEGFTPLQLAVGAAIMDTQEEVLIIDLLLRKGADANARNEHGDTALHMVVYAKHGDTLLRAGARLSVTNNEGATPLHSAVAERDRKDVVLLFLKRGADLCARDRWGKTPKDSMHVNYPDVARSLKIATLACTSKR